MCLPQTAKRRACEAHTDRMLKVVRRHGEEMDNRARGARHLRFQGKQRMEIVLAGAVFGNRCTALGARQSPAGSAFRSSRTHGFTTIFPAIAPDRLIVASS